MDSTAAIRSTPLVAPARAPSGADDTPLNAGYGLTVTYPSQGKGAIILHNGNPPIQAKWQSDGTLALRTLSGGPVSMERARECLQALQNARRDAITPEGQLRHAPGTQTPVPTDAEFRRWAQFNRTLDAVQQITDSGVGAGADRSQAASHSPAPCQPVGVHF